MGKRLMRNRVLACSKSIFPNILVTKREIVVLQYGNPGDTNLTKWPRVVSPVIKHTQSYWCTDVIHWERHITSVAKNAYLWTNHEKASDMLRNIFSQITDQYSSKISVSWKTRKNRNIDWLEKSKETWLLNGILDWILEQKKDLSGKIDEFQIKSIV